MWACKGHTYFNIYALCMWACIVHIYLNIYALYMPTCIGHTYLDIYALYMPACIEHVSINLGMGHLKYTCDMYGTKVTNLLYNIHATYMPYPQPIHPGKKTHFFVIHGKYLPAYKVHIYFNIHAQFLIQAGM